MNLRDVLSRAVRAGLRVEPIRRTGEVRVYSLDRDHSTRVNVRRKDAPRHLAMLVRRAERRV